MSFLNVSKRLHLLVGITTALIAGPVSAATFTYDSDETPLALTADGCNTGNSEFKNFNITDDLTLTQVRVGVNVDHTWRGDVQVYLTGPDGNRRLLKQSANENSQNYDILLDDTSTADPNGSGDHNTDTYANTVGVLPNGNLDAFIGESTVGTWQIEVCDTVTQDVGTFHKARLILDGTVNGGGPSTCTATSPEAVWPLDSNTNDSTTNNHDASSGSVSFNSLDAIVGSGAADFNGSQVLQYSDSTFMNQTFTNMSLSLFLKPDNPNTNQFVFEEGGATNGVAIRFNGGNLEVAVQENHTIHTLSTAWPADGNWHHVGVVYANGNVNLYLDGQDVDNVATGFGPMAAHGNAGGLGGNIGSNAFDQGSPSAFSGLIDEVSYYYRALTTTEIQAIVDCAGIVTGGAPEVTLSFVPASVDVNDGSVVRFTLRNLDTTPVTGLAFNATLPSGIDLTSGTVTTDCTSIQVGSGTQAGGQLIDITGGQLAASEQCNVDFAIDTPQFGSFDLQSSGVDTDQHPVGNVSNTANLAVNPANNGFAMAFSTGSLAAGNTGNLTFTFTNILPSTLTNTSASVTMPAAIWLDSTTLGGTCTGFTVAEVPGSASFNLSGGVVPASGSCTVNVPIRSNVPGSHAVTVSGFSSNETGTVSASVNDTLLVSEQASALCTPGNGSSGAIFMNVNDDIYSVNLETAKATLVTTSNLVNSMNSLAINPNNYLMYYALENGNNGNSNIYYYDLISDTHGLVTQIGGNVFSGMLGSKALSSGGASFYNGSLYMGVEDVPGGGDSVIRVVMSNDGRTALYATRLIDFANGEYGDIVATGGHLHFFVRESSPQFRRYDMSDLSEVLNVSSPSAVQGGAQRDGATIWNVSDSIGFTNVNTGTITITKTITSNGTNGVGQAFDAAGCVPTTNFIGDTVWNDSNSNGVKDADETGIAGVTVDLYYDVNNDGQLTDIDDVDGNGTWGTEDRIQQSTTDNNGRYQFGGLTTDRYVVVISDDNSVLGSAQPTFTSSDPNRPAQAVTLGLLDLIDTVDFGYQGFIDVRGEIIDDHGGDDSANAHNTVKDTDEEGIEVVTINAYDVATSTLIASTQSDADGGFQLLLPLSFQNTDIRIEQSLPPGFVAVNENVGTTGATNADTTDNLITFNTGSTFVYEDIVFSNVKQNVLIPAQVATINAGESTDYPHQFVANSAGDVTFSVLGEATPADPWGEVIYHDANCNNQIDAAEATPIGSAFTGLVKGDSICLIVRISSPSNTAVGARHTASVNADFGYANTSLNATVTINNLTDIGEAALQLTKTVENLTQGSAAGVENDAQPGDVLRYTIRFTNNSNGPVTQLQINDSTPGFTFAKDVDGNGTAIECPTVSGIASLTGCTLLEPASGNVEGYQGSVRWQLDGVLDQGSFGEVIYDVQVE